MMRLMIIGLISLVAVGCSSGSSDYTPPEGVVSVSCADVKNVGTDTICAPTAPAAVVSGVVDAGTVSRGTIVEATVSITNSTAARWQGYWGMVFDAGCNGAETWEIMPPQLTPVVEVGQTITTTVGGQCGDMPLGSRTLTATGYELDMTPLTDGVVQVSFNLVE